MKLSIAMAVCLVMGWAMVGCGIKEATHVSYQNPDETGTGTGTGTGEDDECVKAALAAFSSQVEPAIDSTCSTSSCHATNPVMTLNKSSDSANRVALLSYTGTTSTKLFQMISSATSHGGGDQSGVLPEAKIKAWTDEEAKCQ